MRSRSLGAISGAVSLAMLAAASTGGDVETCASPSTVFVTIQSVVTIHDAPTSTVYIDMSELPTATFTSVETTTSITTQAYAMVTISDVKATIATPIYDATVTETVFATITDVQVVPATSGQTVSYSETAASDGLYNYVVNNGTTYWLNGQTPTEAQSYATETSVVTVVPLETLPASSENETSTLTFHKTVFLTQPLTITETQGPTETVSKFRIYPTTSIGTGTPGFTMAPGGWNMSASTSIVSSVLVTSSLASDALVSYSSIKIYNPPSSVISFLTTLTITSFATESSSTMAAGGPYANNSSTTIISTALGRFTLISSTSYTENSTDPTSFSASAVVTSSTLHALTSISPSLYTKNITSNSLSVSGTSAVLGVLTSLSTTSCTENATNIATIPTSPTNMTSSQTLKLTLSSITSVPLSSGFFSTPVSTLDSSSTSIANSTGSALGVPTTISSSTLVSVHGNDSMSAIPSTSSALDFSPSKSTSASPTITLSSFNSSIVTSMPVLTNSQSVNSTSSSILLTTLLTSTASSSVSSQFSSTQSTSTSTSATPSMCGEAGDFILNFDDIPPLSVFSNQSLNTVQPEPVFNPYHQFDFSDGFVVVPPPTDPYLPSSPPLLLEFVPNFNSNGTNPSSGPNALEFGFSGDVGNGDHGLTGCFGFNAYGASFGCDSMGPDCDFSFTGFRYNRTSGATLPVVQQSVTISACPTFLDLNCELEPIVLPTNFQNLDSLRINVTVAGEPKIWWMDDLALGWYNNTCAAGLCRISTHIH